MQNNTLSLSQIRGLLDPGESFRLEVHGSIDSTNNRAKALALDGVSDVTVIVADRQTAGRGRMGRSFLSPPGSGLYLSVLFRPTIAPELIAQITPFAAVAAAEVIERLSGMPVGIKWVNDLQMNGKKICGILTEAQFGASGQPDFVVLGIGINVGQREWPPELCELAGSIEELCGTCLSRNLLAAELLTALTPLFHGTLPTFLPEYRARSVLLEKPVTVWQGDGHYDGVATAIEDDGALVVTLPGGAQRILHAGEVSVRLR